MTKEFLHSSRGLIVVALFALASCEQSKAPEPKQAEQPNASPPVEERVEKNPDRNAYFGEEHIHTSWSVDAWLMGNRLTGPDDAYKYAQGQTIKHPLGYDIKIDTPMDFMGVTDHSEYVGVTKEANTPGSAISKMPEAQPLILKDPNNQADVQKVFTYLVNMMSKPPVKAFMSPEIAGIHLEGHRPDRGREQPSRQVHGLLLLRVDVAGRTTATCIATSSSATAPRSLRCRTARSTRGIRRTSGNGWTHSARRVTSCWRSRTTPI